MVLRGHEHVVECAEFAPVAAYASIRKLAGLTVSASYETPQFEFAHGLVHCRLRQVTIEPKATVALWSLGLGTRRSGCGTFSRVNA